MTDKWVRKSKAQTRLEQQRGCYEFLSRMPSTHWSEVSENIAQDAVDYWLSAHRGDVPKPADIPPYTLFRLSDKDGVHVFGIGRLNQWVDTDNLFDLLDQGMTTLDALNRLLVPNI